MLVIFGALFQHDPLPVLQERRVKHQGRGGGVDLPETRRRVPSSGRNRCEASVLLNARIFFVNRPPPHQLPRSAVSWVWAKGM